MPAFFISLFLLFFSALSLTAQTKKPTKKVQRPATRVVPPKQKVAHSTIKSDSVYCVGYATSQSDRCAIFTTVQALATDKAASPKKQEENRKELWKHFLFTRPGLEVSTHTVLLFPTAQQAAQEVEHLKGLISEQGLLLYLDVPEEEFHFQTYQIEEHTPHEAAEDLSQRACKCCSKKAS